MLLSEKEIPENENVSKITDITERILHFKS